MWFFILSEKNTSPSCPLLSSSFSLPSPFHFSREAIICHLYYNVVKVSTIYKWTNQGSERLARLPETTQLVRGKVGIQIQVQRHQKPCSFHCTVSKVVQPEPSWAVAATDAVFWRVSWSLSWCPAFCSMCDSVNYFCEAKYAKVSPHCVSAGPAEPAFVEGVDWRRRGKKEAVCSPWAHKWTWQRALAAVPSSASKCRRLMWQKHEQQHRLSQESAQKQKENSSSGLSGARTMESTFVSRMGTRQEEEEENKVILKVPSSWAWSGNWSHNSVVQNSHSL